MLKLFQKRSKSALLTIGTAMGAAALTYKVWGTQLAVLSVLVLLAHEYGHYFAAFFSGSRVQSPFIVPLGFMNIGATSIYSIDPGSRARVAAFGPVFGVLALSICIMLLIAQGHSELMLATLPILAYEIGWGVMGGDGRKYRLAKRGT